MLLKYAVKSSFSNMSRVGSVQERPSMDAGQRQLFDGLRIKHQIFYLFIFFKKVLLAGGVGIQTSPHHQMFLTETAPVTVMDGEHFTLPDIFWMTC